VWVWVLFAEGQLSLPHSRRLPEEGRSTASLLMLKIQNGFAHAIVNFTQAPFRDLLTEALLPKEHKTACGRPTYFTLC